MKILPVDEIYQHLKPPAIRTGTRFSTPPDPTKFSAAFAAAMANLCASAENGQHAFFIEEQLGQVFIACKSSGDPATLLNVRGQTNIDAVPFACGRAYGPLAHQFRRTHQAQASALPVGNPIWLTGHGIGAAFALLAAAVLLGQNQSIEAVYTFGAPRIGDSNFVNGLTCPVFRTVNNLDVIPTMPTSWKWRHAGAHKLINADGTLNPRPNPINRLPSLTRQTIWLGELLKQGLSSGFPRALYNLLNQAIGDHALSQYVERLEALSD